MTPAKPSLELLRSLTDQHVLRALLQERRLTRAEIAARTGISKPTVSESVKRLTKAGLLADTGERTSGRGRIGIYYGLADGLGVALVVGIAPEGIVAETTDVHGQVVAREVEHVQRPARPEQVTRALRTAARRAAVASPGPVRLAVVSAADPVERATGRLVHLPDAPFLLGELSPVHALARVVAGPVVVDNDVNWAARAERSAAAPGELDDFAYLYLGEGLGCAVVADGQVRRGHRGLAGEIAHLLVRGPQGRAVHFTEVFAELGLRQPQSTAIDVAALLQVVGGDGAQPRRVRAVLAEATGGVLAALVALADPQLVVIGGSWGTYPAFVEALTEQLTRLPRRLPVRAAQATNEPSLSGARQQATQDLQAAVLAQPHTRNPDPEST
jgi:predicted NBD/HSP70 family sugar kinase